MGGGNLEFWGIGGEKGREEGRKGSQLHGTKVGEATGGRCPGMEWP